MQHADLHKYDLPDAPGVYYFKQGEDILYIGKATSLRDRVRSYFTDELIESRGPRIVDMVTVADSLDWQTADSVLEALILEALEIKRIQPKYNIREKDDKSYVYAIITKELYPRVLRVRGKDIGTTFPAEMIAHQFGPFPSGPSLKRALEIIRKIFPFYDTKKPISQEGDARMEFNRQIGKYPREITKEEYQRSIRNIQLFLQGKKKQLLSTLEKDMRAAAKAERFEEAERIKRQVFALQHIQDVSLIRDDLRRTPGQRIEGYDIAHTAGSETVGVMTVISDGEPDRSQYRKFIIRTQTNNDVGALEELLRRRFGHPEWEYPKGIVIDGGKGQRNRALKVLEELGLAIPAVAVTKDEHHRPRSILGKQTTAMPEEDIILANAEAHRYALSFHRHRRDKLT